MNKTPCWVCSHPRRSRIERMWDNGLRATTIIKSLGPDPEFAGITPNKLEKHFQRHMEDGPKAAPEPPPSGPSDERARFEFDGINATVTTGATEKDEEDAFEDVFTRFGKRRDSWELISCRESMWEAQRRDEDGYPEVFVMHSYRASFRPLAQETVDLTTGIQEWRDRLKTQATLPAPKVTGEGVTYLIAVADPQLGKKGTQEALENWRRGITEHVARIQRLLVSGWNIEQVVLAFQGDEHEGVANNYANQPHTVEMNLSHQLETDFDMRCWSVEQVSLLGIPVLVTSVISNHGEHTRNGGKDVVTTKSDNSSTMIARMVKRVFDRLPAFSHVEWNIAGANPDIVVNLNGVLTLLTHGHIAKGRGASTEQRAKSAIEKQILGRTVELAELQLIVSAHYHHFYMLESEGRTFFGCPALEALKSSEYMLDQYGVWSPPGMLGMVIGSACGIRGYAEVAVL